MPVVGTLKWPTSPVIRRVQQNAGELRKWRTNFQLQISMFVSSLSPLCADSPCSATGKCVDRGRDDQKRCPRCPRPTVVVLNATDPAAVGVLASVGGLAQLLPAMHCLHCWNCRRAQTNCPAYKFPRCSSCVPRLPFFSLLSSLSLWLRSSVVSVLLSLIAEIHNPRLPIFVTRSSIL